MKSHRFSLGVVFLFVSALNAQGNTTPIGFHDAASGTQPAAACVAAGWATDPDDRNIDLQVRALSDGIMIAQTAASNFRLKGQVKTGHAGSLQNRPYGMAQDVVLIYPTLS